MKGHVVAALVWVGLVGGGYVLVQQMTRPAVVRSCDPGAGVTEVTTTVSPDGHFYLDGAINGVPVRFMVDTGASYVTIGQASAAGAQLRGKGDQATFDTAGGTVIGQLFRGQTVRADCMEVDGATIAVNPQLGEVALLGQNFLRHFEVVQRDRTLLLRRRGGS